MRVVDAVRRRCMNDKGGDGPNDTAYTRWSCHSGLANPVQIVSTPPAPSNGGPINILGHAGHTDLLDGWQCSS